MSDGFRNSAAPAIGAAAGPGGRLTTLAIAGALATVLTMLPGCYAPQLTLLRSGLDSLRTQVDTLNVRDSVAFRLLSETRKDVGEQRDILLSTRATAGSTTQQMYEQMEKLSNRLDEVLSRFRQVAERAPATPSTPGTGAPATPTGPEPGALYDQAAQDLTQGRYALALQGFRDFVQRFPTSELADNAQYGVGECYFAQSKFDSAAVEYGRVEGQYPKGDKVSAALYKLALSQEKLGHSAQARTTLQDLVRRFPQSGEAQLARERLGTSRRP